MYVKSQNDLNYDESIEDSLVSSDFLKLLTKEATFLLN